jgi:UDP-N-acetylmuramoyl-L-alanyl-D-glutamate--2,6-diaminopimelate ligase
MRTSLTALIEPLDVLASKGELEKEITNIHLDSRKVGPGSLFAALRGTQTDGHAYIDMAIERGATAVVLEHWPPAFTTGVTYLQVPDSATALGQIADAYYEHPSRQLQLVGVTGTNGKTTTVTLLHELFTKLGFKTGLLSTVHNRIGTAVAEATHTTPDALSINRLLWEMVQAGCDYAFMEVSSHAAHQRRIAGLQFAGGIFTNISRDHLDYHKTFKAYIEAKKTFFDILPKTAFALVNADDKRGEVMLQNTAARRLTFSLRSMADFRGKILENSIAGLKLKLDGQEVFSRLIGEFNAYNLLAAYGTAMLLQQDQMETLTALSELGPVEGRFDQVRVPGKDCIGIVDYAHTPDALESVLRTITALREADSRIITVVGCGGNRDRGKRPLMARTAAAYSDQVILSSDNPRNEDPESILAEMWEGIPSGDTRKVLTIVSRRDAIRTAAKLAQGRDIVLVAGKGHEKYQEIQGERFAFDDKAVLAAALEE